MHSAPDPGRDLRVLAPKAHAELTDLTIGGDAVLTGEARRGGMQ
jgi:hypothetical protein